MNKLSCVTFTLLNTSINYNYRIKMLTTLLQSLDADIICLQNVLLTCIKSILDTDWGKHYHYNTIDNNNRIHTELILSRYPIIVNESLQFNTTLHNNYLTIVDINIPIGSNITMKDNLTIGTAQLDSISYYQENQIESTLHLLNDNKNVILMGNMNTDEDISLLPDWHDIYYKLGEPLEHQFTVNSELNENVSGHNVYRPDRILYKSTKLKPHLMKLIGVSEQISNHFGIYAEFNIR